MDNEKGMIITGKDQADKLTGAPEKMKAPIIAPQVTCADVDCFFKPNSTGR